MKQELGCIIKGIVVCIVIGIIATLVSYALGNPSDSSITGQFIPLITLAIVVIILIAVGFIKPKN